MGRGHALGLAMVLAAMGCGKSETVAFNLVALDPPPFEGLSRVRMIVGTASGESVTRDFAVPPSGRPSLQVDFPLDEVTSLQLLGYDTADLQATPVGQGAVSAQDIAGGVTSILFTRYGVFHAYTDAGEGQRTNHTATVLADGRVLVVSQQGGELFNPRTGVAEPVSTVGSRDDHGAIRLADGRVVVVGGAADPTTIEIFDPATNSFSPVSTTLARSRASRPGLAELGDGRVLVAGGIAAPNVATPAEILDLATPGVSDAGVQFQNCTQATSLVLSSGELLIAGGGQNSVPLDLVERSDGVSLAAGSVANSRTHAASVELNGEVWVIGGYADGAQTTLVGEVERIDPSNLSVSTLTPLVPVAQAAVAAINGGPSVVIAGGYVLEMGTPAVTDGVTFATRGAGTSITLASTPPGGSVASTLRAARASAQIAGLPDGKIVVVGGVNITGSIPLFEVFTPFPD